MMYRYLTNWTEKSVVIVLAAVRTTIMVGIYAVLLVPSLASSEVVLYASNGQGEEAAAVELGVSQSALADVELLETEAGRVRLWWNCWLGGFAALTAVQAGGYLLFHDDKGMQKEMLVGGAGALLGFAGAAISPVPAVRSNAVQARRLYAAGDTDSALRISALRLDSVRAERDGRNWLNHVLGTVVPVVSSVLLWTVWDRQLGGVTNLAAGLAISAAQIYTQPYNLVRDEQSRMQKMSLLPVLLPGDNGATIPALAVHMRF